MAYVDVQTEFFKMEPVFLIVYQDSPILMEIAFNAHLIVLNAQELFQHALFVNKDSH